MLLDFSLRLRLASVLGNASLPDATNCVKRCIKRGDPTEKGGKWEVDKGVK